jgi:hypothetical protein
VSITDEVRTSIAELQATFPVSAITVAETGDGGAWVCIDPVPTGRAFTQKTTWIAFHIPFTYPEADIYPMFVRDDLARSNRTELGEALSQPVVFWVDGARTGTQISRADRNLDPAASTAVGKVLKVLRWLAAR